MKSSFDAVVIGAGPAGITASIYLKRANLSVVMIDSNAPGGQLNRIAMIENYPGFNKIIGADLAYNMFMQTQNLGIPYKYGKVLDITSENVYKIVKTDKEEIIAKVVIIATGRKPKELGLENEKGLIGRGISWCAVCDGPLFKNKNVVIVGGGNGALEESLYMASIANSVTIVHSLNEFTADETYQQRIASNSKIKSYMNYEITKLDVLDNKLSNVEIMNNENRGVVKIPADGMFIYIGFEPSVDFATSLNLKTDNGYIIVDENMHTNVLGIYACGDVIKKDLYQITTAIGEGSKAAMSAINYASNIKDR